MMDFQTRYLNEMRDRAPAMFNELCRSGQIDAHATEKEREFLSLVRLAVKGEPRLPNGAVRNDNALRSAEEVAAAQLLEFPRE